MKKIQYLSVKETAKRCHISERSVRNYCLQGRIMRALLEGKTWKSFIKQLHYILIDKTYKQL